MYSIPAHPVPFSGIGIPLSMVGQVRAGFPSPAADFAQERVDLIKQLIVHPQATFLMRIRGESIKLRAGNPTYPDIVPKEGQTLEVWGVVTASIKTFRA